MPDVSEPDVSGPERARTPTADDPVEIDSARPGVTGLLARRWPSALAVAASLPGLTDPIGPDGVRTFAEAMLMLPLWYVVVGAVGRRSWTWPVLVVVIALFVLLKMQGRVEPVGVLAGIALAGVLWGTVHGRLRRPSFVLQVIGLVAFGALAVTALLVPYDLGRYVVAAGWLAHGLWDFAHHRANSVIRRSGAEWCGVVDVLIAVQIVVLPLVL